MTANLVNIKKLFGMIMCLVMIVLALYVPVQFNTWADSETQYFSFADAVKEMAQNSAAASDGLGYWGNGVEPLNLDGDDCIGAVLKDNSNGIKKQGGYRLNNANGIYRLEANSTYIIKFKLKIESAPVLTENVQKPNDPGKISIGYGASYSGNGTNYVDGMSRKIVDIFLADFNSDEYTLTVGNTTLKKAYSDDWFDFSYCFTMPSASNVGTRDTSLTFWSWKYNGLAAYIDDVYITKLASDCGVVYAMDEYSGICDVLYGKVGSDVTLPDISDRAKEQTHSFDGWYTDEAAINKAENLKFSADKQTIHAVFKGPVKYTFVDTLNNKKHVVEGYTGDDISFPEDPTDKNGKEWFTGWYTTVALTEEFTATTFGYGDKTLYSAWSSGAGELFQNFDNYKKSETDTDYIDSWTEETDNGVKKKSNRFIFSWIFEKTNEKTYNNSPYAIKCVWDKNMTDDSSNPGDIDAAARYNAPDMYMWIGNGLDNNTQYTLTFKYYLEKADTDLIFYAKSAQNGSIFGNATSYGYNNVNTGAVVSKADAGAGWKEATIKFTTNFNGIGKTMYLGFTLKENKEVIVYMDDVEIKAISQPYESSVIVNANNGDDPVVLKGKRGEAITLPNVTNKNGAEFKGWYLDEALEIPFTSGVFARKPISVYAKWSSVAVTFKDYPYGTVQNNHNFGRTVSIDDSGLGINDDYALRFKFKGSDVYKYKCPHGDLEDASLDVVNAHMESAHNGQGGDIGITYMSTRSNQNEHIAAIGKGIVSDKIYKVTYNYKVVDANAKVLIKLLTADSHSVWSGNTVVYDQINSVSKGASEWQTYSCYISGNVKNTGNTLFILFGVDSTSEDAVADVLVDNVLVEDLGGNIIFFNSNSANVENVTVSGNVGDPFTAPTLTAGKDVFMGWYTDKDCTIPFTATTIPQGITSVYAKWEMGPITFKNYPYPSEQNNHNFGKTVSIDESGLGIDDKYSLRFRFKGDDVYKEQDGETIYLNTRARQNEHNATIARNIENGRVYKVTYKYKVLDSNEKVYIKLVTASAHSVWAGNTVTQSITNSVKKGASDWQTFTGYFSAETKNGGNALFVVFNVDSDSLAAYADVLVDDVHVTDVGENVVFLNGNNSNAENSIIVGEVGNKLQLPSITAAKDTFLGWYSDKECTKKFTATTFPAGVTNLYAKWKKGPITFKNYPYSTTGINHSFGQVMSIDDSGLGYDDAYALRVTYKGDDVYKVVDGVPIYLNTRATHVDHVAKIEENLKDKTTYIISYKYKIIKANSDFTLSTITAAPASVWAGCNRFYADGSNFVTADTKSWRTTTCLITTSIKETANNKGNALFLLFQPASDATTTYIDIVIDEVLVQEVPAGQSVVAIDNGGCNAVPSLLYGKEGQGFADKLPEAPTVKGKKFAGYFTKDSNGSFIELKRPDMKFVKGGFAVYARFVDEKTVQDFETVYKDIHEAAPKYGIFDYDYELYDASKTGNSKDNVTSGNYSLHRKGNSQFFEAAMLLTRGKYISNIGRYTVTMKVKLGNHLHTDGAIKIASSNSFTYAWSTMNEWKSIVAIKDLKEGEWVEVSYTFDSSESFVSIQTPGYIELFIDDVVFTFVDKSVPLTKNLEYTEYVPAKRDANGNIINPDYDKIDVTSIVDSSLLNRKGVSAMNIFIVSGGALLLVAAGVVVLMVLNKKKAKAK